MPERDASPDVATDIVVTETGTDIGPDITVGDAGDATVAMDAADAPVGSDAIDAPMDVPMGIGTCDSYGDPTVSGTFTSPLLDELSGIASSRMNPGVLYVHNDSGDLGRFFAVDQRAQLLGEFRLTGVVPNDWEDMAVGPCGAGSCVYLGDIGDNGMIRTEYAIYRAAEPSIAVGTTPGAPVGLTFERFPFVYPDGPHNAETLLVHPVTGDLYVVLKVPTVTGGAVYRFPRPLTPDVRVTLERVGDFGQDACGALLTSGDIHPSGDRVLLRSRGLVCELRVPSGGSFDAVFSTTGTPVPVGIESQGEAVAYAADGRGYFTTSEGVGAPLHQVQCGTSMYDAGLTDAASTDVTTGDVLVTCGNGMIDPGEVCDGANVGTETCTARGFRAGVVRCLPGCVALDTFGCSNVRVNEVESNPSPDWIEFYNPGPGPADVSGYYYTDNAPEDPTHRGTFLPGTIIPAGGYIVQFSGGEFGFGLGTPDLARLYEPGGTMIDEITWTPHAAGTLARCPDGADNVVDVATPTRGAANNTSCPP